MPHWSRTVTGDQSYIMISSYSINMTIIVRFRSLDMRQVKQVKLTTCSEGEFTCNDGQCITMEQRQVCKEYFLIQLKTSILRFFFAKKANKKNHQHHGTKASLPTIIFANHASKQQTRLTDFGDIVHKSTKYFRIFFSNQGTLSILGATKLLIVSTNQTRTIANSSQ